MYGHDSANHKVTDKNGNVIAEVWDVSENNYVFDYSDLLDPELLILSFIAFQMREEDQKRKK